MGLIGEPIALSPGLFGVQDILVDFKLAGGSGLVQAGFRVGPREVRVDTKVGLGLM